VIIKLLVLATVVLVAGLVLHRCSRHFRGVEVCLHNVDSQPLRSGEVAVRSSLSTRLFEVGDLAPSATACVWVKADNEASVDVTFAMPGRAPEVIQLDGYIEPGYSGSISAEVTGDGARSVKNNVEM